MLSCLFPDTNRLLKYGSLLFITVQNATLILVISYVRHREGDQFVPSTAVLLTEVVKLLTCLTIILIQVSFLLYSSIPGMYVPIY